MFMHYILPKVFRFYPQVMSVEFKHAPEGKEEMISVMKAKNYTVVKELLDLIRKPSDLLLVQNQLISSLNVSAMPEQTDFKVLGKSIS